MKTHHLPLATLLATLLSLTLFWVTPVARAEQSHSPLPAPDGRPADMSKPVQVYILLGQSNMLGFGKINGGNGSLTHATKEKDKYPYLVDDAGNWTVRKDVRNVRVMGSGRGAMKVFNNEWMTIKGKAVGPEIGIGHYVGNATRAPVLILKSCIGNRSLGYDLLPPGAEGREEPKPGGKWYAGKKFYSLIEKIKRSEAKQKGERNAATIKSLTSSLNKFSKREDDNIYGKAAGVVAEKIADPKHKIKSASSYVRAAK